MRQPEGFLGIWRNSPLFARLREWQVGGSCQSCNAYVKCHGGCIAVKHFTGRSPDAPDPDCVFQNDGEHPRPLPTPIKAWPLNPSL